VESATGFFHNLPGDMQRSTARRKWRWLPRFALVAGTIWLAIITFVLLKEHLAEQKSVLIPAGAREAFAAGPEGVGIGRRMVATLNLNKDQVQNVNRILRRYQREFSTLERRHTERSKNAAGHIVLATKPFPGEMDELMKQMWADLSAVLNPGQMAIAKTLHFEKFFPHTGRKPLRVEFWEDENGEFRYVEGGQEPASNNAAPEAPLPQRARGWLLRESQRTNN